MKSKKKDKRKVQAYGNIWEDVQPQTTEELNICEKEMDIVFPENLKDFLLSCAGGYPLKNFYENYKNDIEVSIGYIMPISNFGKRVSLVTEYKELKKKNDFPISLIPFALDYGNANQFCLSQTNGEVLYWLHDEPENRIRKVAKTLNEFLDGLKEPPF